MRAGLLGLLALAALSSSALAQDEGPLPDGVRSAGVTLQEYNEEIETIRAFANARGADARNALARLFAERSWGAMQQGDYPLAARYALAGWRYAPWREADFRGALGRLLHEAGESTWSFEGDEGSQSPDSTRDLRVADGEIVVWDFASASVSQTLRGHSGRVVYARFTPGGELILTAATDGAIRLWDASSGEQVALIEGLEDVRDFRYSADGSIAYISSGNPLDPQIHVIDLDLRREVAVIPLQSLEAISQTGAIATHYHWGALQDEGVVYIRDSLGRIRHRLRGHTDSITFAAFSRVGDRLVTASEDTTARVWGVEPGAELAVLSHPAAVTLATFSGDNALVVTAARDQRARIWSASRGQEIDVLDGHDAEITALAFDASGRSILTADRNGLVQLWDDFIFGWSRVAVFRSHDGAVRSVAFRADGRTVEIRSSTGILRLWEAARTHTVLEVSETDRNRLLAWRAETLVRSTPDDRILVERRGASEVFGRGEEGSSVENLTLSADGSLLASGAIDGVIRIRRLTGDLVAVLRGHTGSVADLSFSDNGTRIVSASADRTARVWDLESNELVSEIRGHAGPVTGHVGVLTAAFSPDAGRVATGGYDCTARVSDAGSGRVLAIMRPLDQAPNALTALTCQINDVAFSPDGGSIVSASNDRTARVWDAATGGERLILRGHDDSVLAARFSGDGTRIATASGDGAIRIWASESGRELARFAGPSRVRDISFEGAGDRLRIVSENSRRVYNVSRLTQSMAQLAADACTNYLLPRHRTFSDIEIGADPLIREVWLAGGRANRDVCENVPGAPPL
ncbi:MAG: hypothetical protein AB7G05_13790 [Hyphomonadaceae bacterium]